MKIWIPQTNPCGLPVARSCGVPVNMRSASSSEPPSGGSELRRLRVGAQPCPASYCLQHLSCFLTLAPALLAATLAGRLCSRLPRSSSQEDSRRPPAHRSDPGKVRSMGVVGGCPSGLCLLTPVRVIVPVCFCHTVIWLGDGPWPAFKETPELISYSWAALAICLPLQALNFSSQSQPVYTTPGYYPFPTAALMDTPHLSYFHSYHLMSLPLPPSLCAAARRSSEKCKSGSRAW